MVIALPDMEAPDWFDSTPEDPRCAVRKDFLHGEDVTIGGWTISTSGLPRYPDVGGERDTS